MQLSDEQIERYSRHVLLPDIGGRGQKRLLRASVAVEIVPGDGAAIALLAYLAAGGIGTLALSGAIDDEVTASDVAAGLLYGADDIGRSRFAALGDRLGALNPDVSVERGGEGVAAAAPEIATDLVEALIVGGGEAARLLRTIARGET